MGRPIKRQFLDFSVPSNHTGSPQDMGKKYKKKKKKWKERKKNNSG